MSPRFSLIKQPARYPDHSGLALLNPAVEGSTFMEASPLAHVSADDAPVLLIHGDADQTVPFEQSEAMEAALRNAGVPSRLIRVPGGSHGVNFEGAANPPDVLGEIVRWLDRHLHLLRMPSPSVVWDSDGAQQLTRRWRAVHKT